MLIVDGPYGAGKITLAGRSLARSADRMNEAEYTTHIAFLLLDSADLYVGASRKRVRKSGPPVPEEDTHRRYTRSKTNVCTLYQPKVNRWILLCSTGRLLQHAAEGAKRARSVLTATRRSSTTSPRHHEYARQPLERSPGGLQRDRLNRDGHRGAASSRESSARHSERLLPKRRSLL